ncbi:MAG: IPT/TIG domain-containing protein [Chitinophagales bacterium]|nr:IPT/TIG domain-containing protein [Chitinophagales bacterium]
MAGNFPEVWLHRVTQNLTTAAQAPWLDGISELDVPVIELGEGSDGESNIIQIPVSTFEPEVLINNSSYPIDIESFTDSTIPIQLDKYQTKATSITDDQAIGAAYDRIDAATRTHTTAISKKKYARAIWALGPASDGVDHPIVETTGEAANGERRPLVYEDLVALKKAFDKMECPVEGRRLVLSTDHWNDLLLDRKRFGDMLVNYNSGGAAPVIAGFKVYSYVNNPYYDKSSGARLAWGASSGTNYQASIAFYEENVAKRTGMTKQYFQAAKDDPQNQLNLLNYRHYYIALPKRNKYIGAIVSVDSDGGLIPAPVITSVLPDEDHKDSDTVVIAGTGFTGATSVKFGTTNAASYQVDSDNSITAVLPTGLSNGQINVTVTTASGVSDAFAVTIAN